VSGIRVLVIAIVTAIVAVAMLPLVVLLDLVGGGDGYGLCRGGIVACRTSYFDGPELVGVVGVVLFLLVVALRAALSAQRAAERRDELAAGRSMSGRDRLGGG
jgi:hypothetical protein